MNKSANTVFMNTLYMDFLSENELDLFFRSLDEIWTDNFIKSSLRMASLDMLSQRFGTKTSTDVPWFLNTKVKVASKPVKKS